MSETHGAVKIQFDDLEQQRQADTLGMWAFLATEVMFFGGLFAAYTIYRVLNPDVFVQASHELNLTAGTINTAVLLTSSLTMALADHLIQARGRHVQWLLAATLALGLLFLCIKGYEYHEEYSHQLIPFLNENFGWEKAHPERAKLFFNLYFLMTGLHAIHLFIGCALVGIIMFLARRNDEPERSISQVKVLALYWHFVDIIWVFLFPLFYLAR